MSDIVRDLRALRAQGHHLEADQIERREILAEMRAKGRHELADQIERGSAIKADGRIDVDALQAQRERELDDFTRFAQAQADGRRLTDKDDRGSVLDALNNHRPGDNDQGPDEGRY